MMGQIPEMCLWSQYPAERRSGHGFSDLGRWPHPSSCNPEVGPTGQVSWRSQTSLLLMRNLTRFKQWQLIDKKLSVPYWANETQPQARCAYGQAAQISGLKAVCPPECQWCPPRRSFRLTLPRSSQQPRIAAALIFKIFFCLWKESPFLVKNSNLTEIPNTSHNTDLILSPPSTHATTRHSWWIFLQIFSE